jgi:hypothetical protein
VRILRVMNVAAVKAPPLIIIPSHRCPTQRVLRGQEGKEEGKKEKRTR